MNQKLIFLSAFLFFFKMQNSALSGLSDQLRQRAREAISSAINHYSKTAIKIEKIQSTAVALENSVYSTATSSVKQKV